MERTEEKMKLGVTCNVILVIKIRCLVPHLSRKREKKSMERDITATCLLRVEGK